MNMSVLPGVIVIFRSQAGNVVGVQDKAVMLDQALTEQHGIVGVGYLMNRGEPEDCQCENEDQSAGKGSRVVTENVAQPHQNPQDNAAGQPSGIAPQRQTSLRRMIVHYR